MKSEDPEYAVKFMMKVREEHLDEAQDVLRGSVEPSFREMGLGELLVLARRRQLEKLDPEGPGVVDSPILKRLLENAPPDEPGYANDLRETSVPYELVTLWRRGVEAREAVEWLVQAGPGALGHALPGGAHEEGHFLSGLGELVLRA